MKNKVKTMLIALLTTLLLTCLFPAPAAGTNETQEYERTTTYIADLESAAKGADANWDGLHEVYYDERGLYGLNISEAAIYGIGFRHKTPGRGKTVICANVTIPAEKDGYVAFALRQADYTDIAEERKGLRICFDSAGRLGLIGDNGRSMLMGEAVCSFEEGRTVRIEDDEDANIITVSIDDGGRTVKAAECVIDEAARTATMIFSDGAYGNIVAEYGYEICRYGYISITSRIRSVFFNDVSVTLPSFSSEPYGKTSGTVRGGENISAVRPAEAMPDGDVPAVRYETNKSALALAVISASAGAVFAALAAIFTVKLIKTLKKKQLSDAAG
ncbi:MAG: hypothetical protein J5950_09125 [Clostridia bacterium]|nr:hypothetical protein [Clostridia bacterium]